MKIACLICGREFDFLCSHLRRAHGVSDREYREQFDIPAGTPLASNEYRAAHADKIRRLQVTGALTYNHLPEAVEAARHASKRPKCSRDATALAETLQRVKPWAAHQLPPGAKRADGRDADKAREYQREYRRRKKRK